MAAWWSGARTTSCSRGELYRTHYAHQAQSDGQPNRPAGAHNAQILIVQGEQR
jgi:hypothetical protein